MYALKLDSNNRVLSVTYSIYAPASWPRVNILPPGDITDYKYINNEFVYDPIPQPEPHKEWKEALDAHANNTNIHTTALEKASWNNKEDIFRYQIMPTPTSQYLNKIVEYVGSTTSDYISGYFYKCQQSQGLYSWVNIDIQQRQMYPVTIEEDTLTFTSSGASIVDDTLVIGSY